MAHILLGVTGSIAAFKACHLASDWSKQGHEVRVVMTAAAQEFVTPLTFSSLTHTQTRTSMFAAQRNDCDVAYTPSNPLHINHVDDAKWADMLVIAPASADIIAKIACGIADDQLTSTVLAYSEGPKILCPAMNVRMYENAVTQRNLNICRELGWTIVEPGSGMLACQDVGKGRMEEPAAIARAVSDYFARRRSLQGRTLLVTAGPTIEPIDPVRYISNHSSGKMGYALAEELRDRGADVILVTGRTALPIPDGMQALEVTTADEMYAAALHAFERCDGAVMCAAVADYAPVSVADRKIKKESEVRSIELRPTRDIAAAIGEIKGPRLLVGFALETDHGLEHAEDKLERKNMDMIVLNSLDDPGAGFGVDTNRVTILHRDGRRNAFGLKNKREVASDIADEIEAFWKKEE